MKKLLDDIKIELLPTGERGGQHVGSMPREVRITHIPTGIVASCDSYMSQYKNKDACLKSLKQQVIDKLGTWDYED